MDMKGLEKDTGIQNPDIEGIKSNLSEKIIGILDEKKLTVRQAHAVTKVSAADFSRIRNADLGRFTIDRLIKILNRLDHHVEVIVKTNKVKNCTGQK